MSKSKIENKKTSAARQPALHKATVVRCAVTHQGAPIINDAILYRKSKDIACIQIDCRSKYCEVDAYFSGSDGECGIYIGANERSLHLKNDVDRGDPTSIMFPDFVGWNVFATSSGRYTISVCLVRVA